MGEVYVLPGDGIADGRVQANSEQAGKSRRLNRQLRLARERRQRFSDHGLALVNGSLVHQ
jgi:hypothetical protein